jgi:hypothetical protein
VAAVVRVRALPAHPYHGQNDAEAPPGGEVRYKQNSLEDHPRNVESQGFAPESDPDLVRGLSGAELWCEGFLWVEPPRSCESGKVRNRRDPADTNPSRNGSVGW